MSIFSSSHGRVSRAHHRRQDHRPSPAVPYNAPKEDTSAEAGLIRVLTSALFALPVTALVGAVLLLIVTAVAYTNPDPDSLTTPLSLATLGLTALLGGLVAARRGQERPFLCGLMLGLLLTLLLLCVSLLFKEDTRQQLTMGFSSPVLWLLHGGVILLSALGGKLGGRRAPQSKHRQRR